MLKSEPETYSFDDLVRDGATAWTGIRNYTARIHLRAMTVGDRAFIYHSGGPKEIVGVCEVTTTAYPDATATGDEAAQGWLCVDIKPIEKLKRPITLAELKAHPTLRHMQLVKLSRLSVSPVTDVEVQTIFDVAEQAAPTSAKAKAKGKTKGKAKPKRKAKAKAKKGVR